MNDRIPKPINLGKKIDSILRYIWVNYTEHNSGETTHSPSDRVVCGFPLPDFQRENVWTVEQEIRFIESLWLDIPVGMFAHQLISWEPGDTPSRWSGLLLDGQQRLTSLERYWEDKFPVFGLLYSELSRQEKNRFLSCKFGHYETNFSSEEEMKAFYNLMAFGGTPHKDHERAV